MRLGTHHGKFHADEVLAIAMLLQLYEESEVIRTRDPDKLRHCDIVVDVGRTQYDHHSTDKTYRQNGIPFASAGLIWQDFGPEIVEEVLRNTEFCHSIAEAIDEKLVQAIDANDNGIELERDWRLKTTSELISLFNPIWNLDEDEDAAFETAVSISSRILRRCIMSEYAKRQANRVVQEAFSNRINKQILVLDTFCPWTECLLDLDKEQEVLFVAFQERTGQYRLQVVPKQIGTFEPRKPLPHAWAGQESTEFQELLSIPDAVFCHPARFIAGAQSKSSIMKMAELALKSES